MKYLNYEMPCLCILLYMSCPIYETSFQEISQLHWDSDFQVTFKDAHNYFTYIARSFFE